MMKYRPLLLIVVSLGLGVLVWLDNRDAILSMWASPAPSRLQATAQVEPPNGAKPESPTDTQQTTTTVSSLLTGNTLASFDMS